MTKEQINYQDFEKLDIKIGLIKKAEPHPNADKLLVLTVDLGEEQDRTICAGIKEYYKPEELEGKSSIFITNLAPRTLRGVESNGMIMAAGSQESKVFTLLTPEKAMKPGTSVS